LNPVDSSFQGIIGLDYPDSDISPLGPANPFVEHASKEGILTLAPLSAISSNLDALFSSSIKAYSTGFLNRTAASHVNVQAALEVDVLALKTSKELFIPAATLVGMVLILAVIAVMNSGEDRQLFDLENLIPVLQGDFETQQEATKDAGSGTSQWETESWHEKGVGHAI
jgi:hypothetical protein